MGRWKKVRLGELAKIRTGKLDANANDENGKFPFFTCAVTPLRIDSYSYDCECVLVAGNGDLNVKYYKGKFDAYQRTYIIENLSNDRLYLPYLYRFLQMYIAVLRTQTSGGVIKYIRLNSLTDAKLPLPPVHEQKRIAKNLDLASKIVKDYKEQLAELDKLVQSVFYEMFGDPVINEKGWISQSLLDFGSCKNGMNFGANENGIEIKYLGVGHFKELSIIDGVDNLSTISLMQAPSKEYLLKDEDIIFVRSNGNKNLVGRCVVVYPGDAALTFSGFCIRFRKSSDKLMTIYLLYVLKCASVRRLLLGRGANIQNLNQQILKQLKVPVPPISLQVQFVEIITEIENQKTQIQQALTEAENLLNSLMQKYFE